jgi:hypothetical protein
MDLHTYTAGATGVALVFAALFVAPDFQAALLKVIQHPSVENILGVLVLAVGAVLAWLGRGPLSTPTPVTVTPAPVEAPKE